MVHMVCLQWKNLFVVLQHPYIKNIWGPAQKIICEVDQCRLNADFAQRSGMLPFDCHHIQSLVSRSKRDTLYIVMGANCNFREVCVNRDTLCLVYKVLFFLQHINIFLHFLLQRKTCCKLGDGGVSLSCRTSLSRKCPEYHTFESNHKKTVLLTVNRPT